MSAIEDIRKFNDQVYGIGKNECWYWQAGTDKRGFGRWKWNGKNELAHVIAYQIEVGPIPAGQQPRQTCGNKLCCNPAHLELRQKAKGGRPRAGPTIAELLAENERLRAEVARLTERLQYASG
jgi:hypothetical protein